MKVITRALEVLVVVVVSGWIPALAFTGSLSLGANLGTITYTYSEEENNCYYTVNGYQIEGFYTILYFSNVVYQNTAVTPNINQSIQGFEEISGSPGPTAGNPDSCPANTYPSTIYNGSGYTIYYYGMSADISIPGYTNPKYQVVGILYAPPGHSSFATYTNTNLVGSTVTTKNSVASSYTYGTSDLISGSISPYQNGSINTSDKSSTSYTQATTTTDSTAVTVQTTTSYETEVKGPVCDYCGVDHDYDLIAVWLNPVQLYTVWGVNNGYTVTDSVQPNGYGYSSWDTPGMDVYYVYAGELNGDLAVRSSTTTAFARSWAGSSNGFTYASGQGPALTAQDELNILMADPFWNCTYLSAVNNGVSCPKPANASFSGTVNTSGTAVTWVSGSTFNNLLDEATIVISGTSYTVAQVNSSTSLTLTASAGTHTGVAYSAASRFTQSTASNFPYAQPDPGGQPAPTVYTWGYTTTNTTGTDVTYSFSQQYALEQVFGAKIFGISFQKTQTQTWTTTQTYETSSQITSSNTSTIQVSITGPTCNVVSGNCSPVYPPGYAYNPVTCAATADPTAFGQGDNMYAYQDNLFGTFLVEPYGEP
jgi:hypothetical protein